MTQVELIKNSRKNLLVYAERHNISVACKAFGVSRTTFYKIKEQYLKTGSLEPKVRRRPRMPNEMAFSKRKILLRFIKENPNWGPARYRYAFRQEGISVSSSCIWYHLKRFDLNNRYKRLIYLESLNKEQKPLTERSLKEIKQKCAKIPTGLWPGHRIALDTFYVGNLKGIGRIYQITGLDLCSRYACAKLYLSRDQITTIDFFENSLIPAFFANNVNIESIVSDNGSEFIGSKFVQMLVDYDIKQERIPKGKPIFNAYCERFQRTIYEELYKKIFRIQFFSSLHQLNEELKKYLLYYNFKRAHFGISKEGAIPIEVLKAKQSYMRHRFHELLT